MALWAEALAPFLSLFSPRNAMSVPAAIGAVPQGAGASVASGAFQTMATGAYGRNPTVYSAIELLATSASEPRVIGRRRRRSKPQIRAQSALWRAQGISNRAGSMLLDAMLVRNEYVEETLDHPLVKLLNKPNPFMSGDDLWSTYVMDRYLAGNSYLLKARGFGDSVQELWRLRPDRVRVIPDRDKFIAGYEYRVDNATFTFPARDVIHWKTRHPLDPYYGMPPLLPITGVIDIDNYLKTFLKTFFEHGGAGPGAILTVKGALSPEVKDEIRDRKRRMFSGPAGAHEWLILDATESTFQKLGLNAGLRDALPKELHAIISAELSMVFGVPGSILGQLIGYESSSYANKRQDWQVLWDVTLTPLMGSLAKVLNRSFLESEPPEFGNIDEVCFDLSNIRALQEDEDALQERARKNVQAGIWSWEEGRAATGMDPNPSEGTFFVPSNVQATPLERLGEESGPAAPSSPVDTMAAFNLAFPRVGRPPLLADPDARGVYERGEALRRDHPSMTLAQVAGRMGVSERTYRRYRDVFRG